MKNIKILHTADLHLDSAFEALPAGKAAIRRAEQRELLGRLAELAREHRISVTRLQKLFKQVYGVPVYHYLREYRLEQAAVELSRSEKRIVDVAMDAGYDSASKFAAVFREAKGKTPLEYRREGR